MDLKALKESPIGKPTQEEVKRTVAINAVIKQAEQKQCLSIGQDLCNLIGSIMVEEPEKGAWLAEKLKPIIQQLQRGAGIDASTK